MKVIHAIYERGVFRPLEAVDLPETTEVIFEPKPVVPRMTPEARAEVPAVLAQRFGSEEDVGGPSLVELADHAEPMGSLTNAEIDRAIYGG